MTVSGDKDVEIHIQCVSKNPP